MVTQSPQTSPCLPVVLAADLGLEVKEMEDQGERHGPPRGPPSIWCLGGDGCHGTSDPGSCQGQRTLAPPPPAAPGWGLCPEKTPSFSFNQRPPSWKQLQEAKTRTAQRQVNICSHSHISLHFLVLCLGFLSCKRGNNLPVGSFSVLNQLMHIQHLVQCLPPS